MHKGISYCLKASISLKTCFLLLFFAIGAGHVTAQEVANRKTFSISFRGKTLAYILNYINRAGDYPIVYGNDLKNLNDTLTVSFDGSDGLTAVKSVIRYLPLTYQLSNDTIRITALNQETGQGRRLSGMITDDKGHPVSYATIKENGTSNGTTSADDGRFSFAVSRFPADVTVTCIGYESQNIRVNTEADIRKIRLKASNYNLDQVTVIAYGKRSTHDLVGSISTVKSKDLQNVPNATIETLLQGRMAGVEVNNLSGTPGGGGSQVLIRGYSSLNLQGVNDGSPLYVIDGVPVVSTTGTQTGGINTLASLDPSSIESVEVLKDAASAALYGSRASNGVILITTKKGKSGKTTVGVNVSQSLSWLPVTPTQIQGKGERDFALLLSRNQRIGHYDYMNNTTVLPQGYNDTWGWDADGDGAYDYLWRNGKLSDKWSALPAMAQDSLNPFYNNRTNWWKYAFRVGRVTKTNVIINGGTDNVRYMLNAGFYDEKGIMISSSFQRVSLLSNLDFKLSTKLNMFSRINLSYASKNAGSDMGKIQGLTFDPKATSTLLPGKGSVAEEEAVKNLRDIKRENSNYNIRVNLGLNYELLKGLRFSSTFALDHYMTRSYSFLPTYLTQNKLSEAGGSNVMMTNLQTENTLTYNFTLKKNHNFELLAGTTWNHDLLQLISGTAQGGPTNNVIYVGDGWPTIRQNEYGTYEALQTFGSNKEVQSMLSFLGRFAYNYKRRYPVEFSLRSDGSSVFGRNTRWGTFPAVGTGWVFSEEAFMKPLWWLSFGKLRASWGRSGQKFQEAYLAQGIMQESNTYLGTLGLIPQTFANNDLTWEKTDQTDIGLDLQFLDYRLRFKFDYYSKYSHALLMQIPMPGNVYLADKMWSNASAILNEGLEIEGEADVISNDKFKWTLGFTLSHDRNRLKKTPGNIDLEDKVIGRPIYGIYTYKDEGIVQDESQIPYYYKETGEKQPLVFGNSLYPLRVGGRKIKDQNSDGVIDMQDMYYAGSTIPAAYGGISSHVEWKGLSLDILFNYTFRRKVMNMVKNSAFLFNKNFGVIMNDYRKVSFWQAPGDETDYPSLEFADDGYVGQFDGNIDSNIETVSFLRLKQMVLGYKLPKGLLAKTFLKEAFVYMSAENLFLLSNYSGTDPETIDPYTGKDDGNTYPLNRKITFGVNLKF